MAAVHPRARGPAHACLGSAAHAHIVRLTCVSRGYRAYSAVRACSTRGQAPLCPDRRPPRPQHPIVSVFRRGGLHFGRLTALNRDLTNPNRDLAATKRGNCAVRGTRLSLAHVEGATKRGELHHERRMVELGPCRGRHQTGELRCERCTVELGPRRGRHQTGGIAP